MKIFILLLIVFSFSTQKVNASSNICKLGIKPALKSELAYKQRGNRCEGLFVQKVSATGLKIAAFHMNPANYDDRSLAINITSNNIEATKTLTATSLRPRQFYRMDTTHTGPNYSLSLDVILHPDVNVKPSDFAVVICKENCETSIPTLIPASFVDNGPFNFHCRTRTVAKSPSCEDGVCSYSRNAKFECEGRKV